MKYEVRFTSQFKKDYKLSQRRHRDIPKLMDVINMLATGGDLPETFHDHPLVGNYHNCRECHITPDWLLIYKLYDDILVLQCMRTGTHADLFKK